MTDKPLKEALQEYETELGTYDLTLPRLIDSHRHLRGLNLELNDARLQALKEAREHGREQARKEALDMEWFSRDRLRAMTLGELTKLLFEDED